MLAMIKALTIQTRIESELLHGVRSKTQLWI